MTRTGTIRGEFEVEHPTTDDVYTIYVVIDYIDEDDTYDTQGSLDWDYEVEWVEHENGEQCMDTTWLTYEMMSGELENILENRIND